MNELIEKLGTDAGLTLEFCKRKISYVRWCGRQYF
jgi:hypothetical protein